MDIIGLLELSLMFLFTSGFLYYSRKRIEDAQKVTWMGPNTLAILHGAAILYLFLWLSNSFALDMYNKVIYILIIPYIISELISVLRTYVIPNALENPLIRLTILITMSVYLVALTPTSSGRFIIMSCILLYWLGESKAIYNTIKEVHMVEYINVTIKFTSKSVMRFFNGIKYVVTDIYSGIKKRLPKKSQEAKK